MPLAPVEYLVIRFPGNRFDGSIAPAIARLVESETVHIIDLVFIKKAADGSVQHFEFDDLEEGQAFADVDGEADGVIASDDIAEAAAALELDSAALFVVWEDLWAAELAEAIWNAGGELAYGGRIPRHAIEAALAAAGEETS